MITSSSFLEVIAMDQNLIPFRSHQSSWETDVHPPNMFQLIIIGFHPWVHDPLITIIYPTHFLVGFQPLCVTQLITHRDATAVHDVVIAREAVGPVFLDLEVSEKPGGSLGSWRSVVSWWNLSMSCISIFIVMAGEICQAAMPSSPYRNS